MVGRIFFYLMHFFLYGDDSVTICTNGKIHWNSLKNTEIFRNGNLKNTTFFLGPNQLETSQGFSKI